MGVRNVATFLLDMVCIVVGLENQRAMPLLVHDSHLFDAIDSRQAASCLNIGARLAQEHGFQYVVTLNSDYLSKVEEESENAFDGHGYLMSPRLTDASPSGKLMGFDFA